MTTPTITRSWPRKSLTLLLALAWAAAASSHLHASTFYATLASTPVCVATENGWQCYLPGILQFLEVIAMVLGAVLVLVVALAVKSYVKNKDDQKHNQKVGP
jgi:hypothetical protein